MPTLLAAHRNSVITCVICCWKNLMCNPYRHQSQCVVIFMARLAHSELPKSLVYSQNWYCRPVCNLSLTQPNHSAAHFWYGRWLHCGWLRLVGKTILDIRVDSLSMELCLLLLVDRSQHLCLLLIHTHKINSHEIISHEINSHQINFPQDQLPQGQLPPDQLLIKVVMKCDSVWVNVGSRSVPLQWSVPLQ